MKRDIPITWQQRTEFYSAFPDDETCLAWLWQVRYALDGKHAYCPKCKQVRSFSRIKVRRSYTCHHCGLHIHPAAGTIFHKSATPLQMWFFAVWLLSGSHRRITAKQLEREFGVSYKTAWRMRKTIQDAIYGEGMF